MPEENKVLLEKIQHVLYSDTLIDLSNIKIDLKDNKVRISGSVPSLAAFNAAENDILSVDGVKEIENNLEIVYPGDQNNFADSNLQKQLTFALQAETSIGKTSHINVQNGIITLTGTVKNDEEKEHIKSTIRKKTSSIIIVDKLIIMNSQTDTDRFIANEIRITLDQIDPLNNYALVIHLENGNVTMEGKVRDWNELNRIEYAIHKIQGVAHVNNYMILD
jgi:hyperosmotically inducible periplasmic protein